MANNYSQLAILEGNENCIPVRLGSGRSVDIPAHFFHTKLYPVNEVIDHEDKQLLNGIVKHFEAEDLLMGDDGFIYASVSPGDQTLSGDDYEPIALLDGDDLSLAGFKFKMPRLPGQKKKSGALVKTRSSLLNKAGNLATKGYRTFTLPGALSKKGIIGRNLKSLKNPFKSLKLKLPKLKFRNPFKGGKGGSGMADALQQFQDMQAQSQSEEVPEEEETTEEASVEEANYSEDTSSEYTDQPEDNEEYSDQSQEEYSADEVIPDDPGMEQEEEYPAEVSGAATQNKTQVANQAFNTVNSAIGLVPGIGTAASSVLSIGKGLYDSNQQDKAAKKEQVSQSRIALLQNLIKKNPQKKVVVKKKPAPKPIAKTSATAIRFSSDPKQLQLTQSSQVSEPSYGAEEKKDNKGLLIGLGIAAAAGIGLAMSGKE